MNVVLISADPEALLALQAAIQRLGVAIDVWHFDVVRAPGRNSQDTPDLLLVDTDSLGDQIENLRQFLIERASIDAVAISAIDRSDGVLLALRLGLCRVVSKRRLHWLLLDVLQRVASSDASSFCTKCPG